LLKLLAAKIKENVDLMSFFTQQIKISFGERLLVPLVNWGLLSFLPLWLTNNDNSSFFAVAQGQCVLVTKKAYFSVGGHECVRSAILDDAQLAIEFKKKGFNILIGTAKEVINCRMYRSLKESFMGFSKNTFTATKVHWSVFLFLYTVIFIISLLAYIGPFFSLMFLPLTFWVVLQQLIFWRLAGEDFWFNIIFYPVQITLFYVVGLHSFFYSVFSKVEWKGREYKL